MKKSQTWSMDIMIAIVIFMGTIFIFYSILNNNPDDKTRELQEDASRVLKNIASEDSDVGIIEGVEVNKTRLEELLGEDYSEIKKKLRVKNEFCLFLEDENGNIIYLTPEQAGVGSEKINISGIPCG
ncbi:MAG: hypothetical protein V1831_00240 [Candidatus Woesearchaeota archaeon]